MEDKDLDEMMTMMMSLIMMMLMVTSIQVGQANASTNALALSAQSYIGKMAIETVTVNGALRYYEIIGTPWNWVHIVNKGDIQVNVGINSTEAMFTIEGNSGKTIDRKLADERITRIYHQCRNGVSVIELTGEY